MKNCSRSLFLIFAILSASFANPATVDAQTSTCTSYIAGQPYTYPCFPTNPGSVVTGALALGPFTLPIPPAGSTDFVDGDSIFLGGGATSCSLTYGVVVTTPTGTCMADLVAVHDGAKELGYPVLGTCLVFTATDPNGLCNKASTTAGSLINRYASDATHITPNMRVYVMIGTNDAFSWSNGNTLVSAATFKANLATVLAAFATASGSAKNIVVSEIPHMPTAFAAQENAIDAAIDDVANQYGYALAANASTIQNCALATPSTDSCTFDATHPDNAGHAAMAIGLEGANYWNAIGAAAAAKQSLANNYLTNGTTNVLFGGRATAYLSVGTAAQNNTCGGYSGCAALTAGSSNTVVGAFAGNAITTSNNNSCFGQQACAATAGQGNVCLGFSACSVGGALNFITVVGSQAAALSAVDSFEIVIGQGITGLGSNTVKVCSGSAPCFSSGAGAPTFSAPSGSIYLRIDGVVGTSSFYINTSATNTSGTTWTPKF